MAEDSATTKSKNILTFKPKKSNPIADTSKQDTSVLLLDQDSSTKNTNIEVVDNEDDSILSFPSFLPKNKQNYVSLHSSEKPQEDPIIFTQDNENTQNENNFYNENNNELFTTPNTKNILQQQQQQQQQSQQQSQQ